MSYIRFDYLDDLLAFLRACEERETRLGKVGNRALYEKISLSRGERSPIYAISVDDHHKVLVENEFLYGGRFVTGATAPGAVEDINVLLKRLPLRVRRDHPRHIPALVLAARLGNADFRTMQQRVHEAWRDIPRQQYASSTFYMCTDGGTPAWLAVHVDAVEPWFSYEQWSQKHRVPDLHLFVPPETSEDMRFLFVQWGYEYPKPRDFYLLYDETQDQDALLLCTAGDPLPQGGALGVNPLHVWHRPEWHVVRDRVGSRSDEIWQITDDAIPSVQDLTGEALPEAVVQLPLAVGDTRKAVGSLAQLDQRISLMERELEDLHARRNRIKSSFHREFVPIYVFRDGTDGTLPADMTRFLSRPLGELAMFQYVRGNMHGEDTHCVIGTLPVALGAALSVPCTATYLQDRRWLDWGLPLFVRSDCSLSLDIEEQEMAERLWGIMQDARVPRDAKAILVAPGDQEVGDFYALNLVALSGGNRLDQCLAYVNAGGPVPEAMVVQGIQSLDATVTEHRIEVPDELTAAVSALHQASQARVEEAEGKWEEIRQKTRAVLFDARVTDVALDVTSEAYQLAPASWKEFVERVMAIDEQIAKMKLEALERWTASGQEREDRLSVIEESLLDIKKEIESKEKEFQDKLRALKQQEAEIIPTVTKVEELKGKLQREQQKLTATQQALDKNIAEVEQRTASTKRDTERKDAAKQRLEFVKQREQQQTRADDESLKKLEDAIRDANQLAARRRIELETLEMETRGGRWTRWMRRLRRR